MSLSSRHIKEFQRKRFLFLKKLFEITNGDSLVSVNVWQLGTKLGFTQVETEQIDNFLSGEGLIEHVAFGGTIVITHKALVYLESALLNSEGGSNNSLTVGENIADSNVILGNNNTIINMDKSVRDNTYDSLNKEEVFKLIAREPLEKEPQEFRWASIDIENVSPSILEKCFVVLDDVLDIEGKSLLQIKRKRRLLWSWGEGAASREVEKDIIPGEPKVVDVATTAPTNQQFTFETHTGQESKSQGLYEVIITAYGRLSNQPKTKTSRFILEYSGGNILTIINKGNENWSNPNPKKREIRDQGFTDLASPSS